MVAAEETALTERQIAVLRLRADGHTHGEIADRLDAADRAEATGAVEVIDTAGATDVAGASDASDPAGTPHTTAADVRDIEHAAERTVRRARRTLDLAAAIQRSPTEIAAVADTTIEELADEIYARGDDAGIKVDYCHADLHARLRDVLEGQIEDDRLQASATLTLAEDGRVRAGGRDEGDDFDEDRSAENEPIDADDRSRGEDEEHGRSAGGGRG